MTHLIAYLAGILTALILCWTWMGYAITNAGAEE